MSITIINNVAVPEKVSARDFKDGCAYMDESGDIFVANKYLEVRGFSLCGNKIASYYPHEHDDGPYYTPVNLTVTVSY